ncbi:hypothetical protein HOLleu_35687 [Holothuria leucospilota]|uniref:Uncharacterized protein n=1 Tax=Holothuria leucospilota TaxID=206669 RepID=A0A9Q0YJA9_HOLLE|nr:hypothetical protein HOLleu_35687 [Holothuria leucospilota]
MFPNIDNNLGIKAVKEALARRDSSIPCNECSLEAVEICSSFNNSCFNGNNFFANPWHCHGT